MRGDIARGMIATLVTAAAACGEAGVRYQGVIIEDEKEAARWFDTSPAVGRPVPGAIVQLCIDGGCGDDLFYTDETGYYRTHLAMFAGTICSRTTVEVRVTAPDGRQAGYVTVYEDTTDPTDIQLYCGDDTPLEDCPEYFLNFQLGP